RPPTPTTRRPSARSTTSCPRTPSARGGPRCCGSSSSCRVCSARPTAGSTGRPPPATTCAGSWTCCRSRCRRPRSLRLMRVTGAEQVEEAVADCVAALGAVTGHDWGEARAGRLEWTCRETAVHIAEDLFGYAGQLAGRHREGYAPFGISLEDGADDEGVLRVIATGGALLAAAVRTTPRAVRAWHPFPFQQ